MGAWDLARRHSRLLPIRNRLNGVVGRRIEQDFSLGADRLNELVGRRITQSFSLGIWCSVRNVVRLLCLLCLLLGLL
jgi:hypothetical protein